MEANTGRTFRFTPATYNVKKFKNLREHMVSNFKVTSHFKAYSSQKLASMHKKVKHVKQTSRTLAQIFISLS